MKDRKTETSPKMQFEKPSINYTEKKENYRNTSKLKDIRILKKYTNYNKF